MAAMAGCSSRATARFRSFGPRHDHGRRHRDARLAHRVAGNPVEARRPREKGRIPFPRPAAPPERENRVWSKVLTPALRHPVIAAAASAAVLLAMAVPVLHLHTAESGIAGLPRKCPPRFETLDRIQEAFTGAVTPAVVAVTTPSTDSATSRTPTTRSAARRASPARCTARSSSRSTGRTTVARITISLLRGPAPTRRRTRHSQCLRNDRPSLDDRHAADHGLRRHRRDRSIARQQRGDEALRAARVRLRVCCWRSCSCSSRSGRS